MCVWHSGTISSIMIETGHVFSETVIMWLAVTALSAAKGVFLVKCNLRLFARSPRPHHTIITTPNIQCAVEVAII